MGEMEGVVGAVEETFGIDVLVILAVDVNVLDILDVEALFVSTKVLVKRADVGVVSSLLGLLLELLVNEVVAVTVAPAVIIINIKGITLQYLRYFFSKRKSNENSTLIIEHTYLLVERHLSKVSRDVEQYLVSGSAADQWWFDS